jgi:predicted  nucleic acid-binding Zn-ribbon protein
MSAVPGAIAKLHQLHQQLDKYESQLSDGPKRISAGELAIKKKEEAIAAQKQELFNLQKSADGMNLQFKTTESKIGDLKGKLNASATNVEYQILKNQVANETAANVAMEEQYLQQTELIDTGKARLAVLNQELEAAKVYLKKLREEVAAAEAGLRVHIAEYQAKVKEASACVPEEKREYYTRLTKRDGANGFSTVEDGCCEECSTEVTPQTRVELKSGKVFVCSTCGRFQYVI